MLFYAVTANHKSVEDSSSLYNPSEAETVVQLIQKLLASPTIKLSTGEVSTTES